MFFVFKYLEQYLSLRMFECAKNDKGILLKEIKKNIKQFFSDNNKCPVSYLITAHNNYLFQ